MRISVISCTGTPLAVPLAFDFGKEGGSIGRDEANQLVLPDPDRHISRVQARVEFDGQQFLLVDMGANPSLVNGRPLGKGNRVVLTGGEEISIAAYVLRVEYAHAPPVFSSPVAEQLPVDDPLGLSGSWQAPGAKAFSRPAGLPGTPAADVAAGAARALPVDDPFAVFAAPSARSSGDASRADGDQFEHDPFAAPPPPPAMAAIDPLGLGFGSSEDSVDSVFELDGSAADPLAGTPLADSAPEPTAAQRKGVDPLALFGGSAAGRDYTPQRDDGPILNQAISLPRVKPDPAIEMTQVSASKERLVQPVAGNPAPARAGVMVRSWDEAPAAGQEGGARTVGEAQVSARPPADEVASAARVEAASAPDAAPPPLAAAAGSHADLLEALQRGLGVPVNLPAGLTPELMEQIGLMLREAMQGTIDLLMARAETKREVRAQPTLVVSKGNNPLKFSPDVGFALSQLLSPRGTGFMKPEAAMRDAYDDLRAHQLGFMAGMSAALAGVLKRFEPAELEQRVAERSVLDNILPGSRKAKLWDLFEEMYEEISREASDDFHTLFGREFLKAYEEQVRRLDRERDPGG